MELSQYIQMVYSPTFILLSTAAVFYYVIFVLFKRQDLDPRWNVQAPLPASRDWPLIGDLRFFTDRWNLFESERKLSKTGCFSFHVGKAHVTGLTGHTARINYLNHPQLSLSQGFSFLFGAQPQAPVDESATTTRTEFDEYFYKRLNILLSPKFLNSRLPVLVNDVDRRLKVLKERYPNGVFNPFDELPDLVFQLTMRMLGADDVANDDEWCKEVRLLFEEFERLFTATTVIAPWLPTPRSIKRFYYGFKLFRTFDKIRQKRLASGEKGDDALQILMDKGDDSKQIIQFVLNSLFAGQINSSINAAYLLYCVSLDEKSKQRAIEEIRKAGQEHCEPSKKDAPLVQQLASLSMSDWETQFPFLDISLKESIRHMLQGSSLRKNVTTKPITLGDGVVIPPGAYAVWRFADSHLDPAVFPEPDVWDPARFDEKNEKPAFNQSVQYGYMGWGAGRHICGGMRFAKLEMSIMVAMALAHFPNITACNPSGEPLRAKDDHRPIRTIISTDNPSKPVTAEFPLPTLPLNGLGTKRPEASTWVNMRA